MAEESGELVASNEVGHDEVELRRRLDEDGYLFFRRLVDPTRLLELRGQIMEVLSQAGWLRPGSDPMAGIADVSRRCTEGDLAYSEVYVRIQRLELFHSIPHDDELVGMVAKLMETRPIPVPGNKARIWFPRFVEHTTPMHQDFVHYQGSLKALTCWAPVGDCPVALGPLAVLPGSHKVRKVLDHHFSLGAGGLIIDLERSASRYPDLRSGWLTADFRAGDVLFFPALTIHRALPNTTEDLLRVSLDNRYQREGDNIAQHMLEPHLSDLSHQGWEDIYAGWESDELKYYWRKMRHRVVPKYLGYSRKGFAEALELARNGDTRAILALRRTIKQDPASEDARAAIALFEEAGIPA